MKHTINDVVPMAPDAERLRFMLVYQAGIANIFEVECANLQPFGRNAKQVYQGDFRTAEAMAHGMGKAGAIVHTVACNQAGDISGAKWNANLDDQPFSEQFCPVFYIRGL